MYFIGTNFRGDRFAKVYFTQNARKMRFEKVKSGKKKSFDTEIRES